jgi:prepilin-type N-terminal cleavage/methylation domain-containing protein
MLARRLFPLDRLATRSRAASRGVTLIELIIVIAIISIVAVLAVPNMTVWMGRLRLNAAASALKSRIDNTRKLAISEVQRHCLEFTGDSSFSNLDDRTNFGFTITVKEESGGFNSAVWNTLSEADIGGFVNGPSTDLYPGVSIEAGGSNTTVFATTDSCNGMLFNMQGYLANPTADFATACGGGNCARITLRQKGSPTQEQRTLWIDRGGNVRITQGPSSPPVLGS